MSSSPPPGNDPAAAGSDPWATPQQPAPGEYGGQPDPTQAWPAAPSQYPGAPGPSYGSAPYTYGTPPAAPSQYGAGQYGAGQYSAGQQGGGQYGGGQYADPSGGQYGGQYGAPASGQYGGQYAAPAGQYGAGGYGYPPSPYGAPAPTGAQKVDGFAITSLIFGIIGGIPFAIGFAIAALVRISRGRRRGKGLAIAGLVLSGVWIVGITLLVVFAPKNTPTRSSSGAVTHQGQISPTDLRVGDCVELPAALSTGTIRTVTVLPCSELHNGQVFTTVQATNASYPGQDALTTQGLDDCQSRVEAFTGQSSTELHIVAFVPDSDGWTAGDRTETCLLVDRQNDITGDIRPHA
jgi:hypothetical protein